MEFEDLIDVVQKLVDRHPTSRPPIDLSRAIHRWAMKELPSETERLPSTASVKWMELDEHEQKLRMGRNALRLSMAGPRLQDAFHLVAARRLAEKDAPLLVEACVHQCRRHDWSWAQVAHVCHMSRQGAQQKWPDRFDDRLPPPPPVDKLDWGS